MKSHTFTQKAQQKTVLITGGSSGIGKELALHFHIAGYRVLIVGLYKKELTQARQDLYANSPGGSIDILEWDLTSTDTSKKILAWTKSLGVKIDILINNAGFGLWGEATDLPAAKVESMLLLNVNAITSLTSTFGKQMKEDGHGTIMNVASTASLQALPFMAAYAASKSYVVRFSEAIAEELAPHGIKVCILYPGTTRTNFLNVAGIQKNDKKGSLGNMAYRVAMDPKEVARIGFEGVLAGKKKIVPGTLNKLHYLSTKIFPNWVVRKIAARIFGKA
ncbi:KR domain protein [Leptospira fainei serovar Hurstbridge str. BUT 6]|uniref:KR domain protein n=1 Tax=Leptospira fainei serovar Hurstbridge str. BUT 6 TaxID=1193011 RepID=S3V9N2_9LEPT|nr:SDR family NAD(P)-dependent oxidoreductase [Leptospira fainei]EPG73120.1 KR domain protein [Leptospira fainei serovar Hurstbridge str. BUT 6]